MEIITVQYRDGHDQTFESDGDLSETWTTLCDEPNVLFARYRVPARYTPSGTRTYGTIGISRGEAARLKAEHDAQVAAIQACQWCNLSKGPKNGDEFIAFLSSAQ
jgi:hypothetical protein